MELSEPVGSIGDLAGHITARAERDPAMPVTVLFRAEDTDYERGGNLYWARSDIGAVVECGGILYLIALDPQAVSTYESAPDVTDAVDEHLQRQRSAAAARVADLEAQLKQARADLNDYRGTGQTAYLG